MTYHQGELAMQASAGVQAMAQRIGRGIHTTIFPAAAEFLEYLTVAATASVDAQGYVWASLLTGEPGFLHVADENTLHIAATPVNGDPLFDNLRVNPALGLVAIDFASRQRVRLNGTGQIRPDGIELTTQQVYANCQKHIQMRLPVAAGHIPLDVQHSDGLNTAQQHFIGQADTLFIASYHPEGGADASHRGGNPGFVRVSNAGRLEFPDYPGNSMFNTLGNITVNPATGLLFPDFEHGSTLQLTGRATIIADAERAATFPGAERVVEFEVERVIEISGAIPFQFTLMRYSPYNFPAK